MIDAAAHARRRRDELILHPAPHRATVPTRRACQAAALLGYPLDDQQPFSAARADTPPQPLPLPRGTVTLITGPSGSGKSTLLHQICAAARDEWSIPWRTITLAPHSALPDRATVDLFDGPVERAMGALARVGLGEASLFVARAGSLSEGQGWRLRLGLALERAERDAGARNGDRTIVVIDEFASGLDRVAARALAHLIRRRADRAAQPHGPDTRFVIATVRDDLDDVLQPDRIVEAQPGGRVHARAIARVPVDAPLPGLRIEPASIADYRRLAPMHYRAGPPATVACVLRAVLDAPWVGPADPPLLAGVLVASMPTLNASWRHDAWPGRYTGHDKRLAARRLNDEVRTISRVVVDPRIRALGIARALVRAYLDHPLTRRTEAVAAMGAVCPFFERAGMTPHTLVPRPHHARLLDAFASIGIEPWRLPMTRSVLDRITSAPPADRAAFECELVRWARVSRATRRWSNEPLPRLLRRACIAVAAGGASIAYTHDQTTR